jgi:uncharacterized protein YjgD (DUF1641 family)
MGEVMIIKRAIAVESLTKVCEESLNLIKQLIDADNEVYAKGYEDGVAAQAKVQQTLKPFAGLTDEEIQKALGVTAESSNWNMVMVLEWAKKIETAILEKNNG